MSPFSESNRLFEQAQRLFPGGVQSPVRAFGSVGGTPPFISHGAGSRIFDQDDHSYVDYVLSYGPMILGHAHPAVTDAIKSAADKGTSFGAPTEGSLRLGEIIQQQMPSLEMLRFVNSGTEATMSALRLARAFTGKNRIIKMEGCYHGHADFLLVQAGSGVATLGLPDSPGVTSGNVSDTLSCPFNDLASISKAFETYPGDIAAIIVEPVAGNMGLVMPAEGYLEGLRSLCNQHGSLLIFDEVMTGFRVGPGGAQGHWGVTPDLTTLGKVIGGGLPVGAYGGKREIMQMVAPSGPVYQAGTLSGNPLAMAAGLATLENLRDSDPWQQFETYQSQVAEGLSQLAAKAGIPFCTASLGSMSGSYFLSQPPGNWQQVKQTNSNWFRVYFHQMLEQGVYIAPSPFEAAFISTQHGQQEIELTLAAAKVAFQKVADSMD